MSRKSARPSDIKNFDFVNAGTLRPKSLSSRRERWPIALLCLAAALRIFFFSAAFPFFNNVDEYHHLDLILKYSQNQWPSMGTELANRETNRNLFLWRPEHLHSADGLPGGSIWPSPVFHAFRHQRAKAARVFGVNQIRQHEEYSPPLYYLLAGEWLSLGKDDWASGTRVCCIGPVL